MAVIVKTPDVCGGKARLEGRRIRVLDIAIAYERMSLSPDEIVQRYDALTLGDVHSALAYYYDHRLAILEEIAAEELALAAARSEHGSLLSQRQAERGQLAS